MAAPHATVELSEVEVSASTAPSPSSGDVTSLWTSRLDMALVGNDDASLMGLLNEGAMAPPDKPWKDKQCK